MEPYVERLHNKLDSSTPEELKTPYVAIGKAVVAKLQDNMAQVDEALKNGDGTLHKLKKISDALKSSMALDAMGFITFRQRMSYVPVTEFQDDSTMKQITDITDITLKMIEKLHHVDPLGST